MWNSMEFTLFKVMGTYTLNNTGLILNGQNDKKFMSFCKF